MRSIAVFIFSLSIKKNKEKKRIKFTIDTYIDSNYTNINN